MTQTLNIKRQFAIILRYCYSARRAAQNIANRLGLILSSRCILNMKCLVTPKYKQGKTPKTSSENNLKVRRQPH